MVEETTSHLGLQLPHATNSLEDDVLRLRAAITAIDAKFQAIDALLASDDINLDALQELVTAIKGDAATLLAHIGARGTSVHAVATGSIAGFMSAADKTKLDEVALGPLFDSVIITPTSSGQTAFTVTGGGYTPGRIMVYLNGSKLAPDDYTATTSPNLVLAVGAETVDTIEVVRFKQALAA